MIKRLFLILFLLCGVIAKAQTYPDSLQGKSFDYLFNKHDSAETIDEQDVYANAIVAKAKTEKDTISLVAGYHFKSLVSTDTLRFVYQDSIINLLKNNSNKYQPSVAYLTKAYFYFNQQDYKKTLDNVIAANKLAIKHNNEDLIETCNYYVGTLLSRIGDDQEALKIYRENYSYAKAHVLENPDNFLESIIALSVVYVDLRQLDSASFYNHYGFQKALEFKNKKFQNHFRLYEGISQYYQKNFAIALDSIHASMPEIVVRDNKHNLAIAYFYLAKAYKEFNNTQETLKYLKKVDTIFRVSHSLPPETEGIYELLIHYYKEKGDLKNQLIYSKQRIKLDSTLHSNEIYINKNLFKQYDIPKLISGKETIITNIKNKELKKSNIIIALCVLLLLVTLAFWYQWYKRNVNKRRFLEIINKDSISCTTKQEPLKNLSKEIVESVLKALEEFEEKQSYLDAEMTIQSLAKDINSNANYLSKIINYFKQQSFTNYINGLRIDYAINRLKKDKVFRNYTIDAIAGDSGFKKAESFSRAFYKETGMKPSFFIKELKATKNR